jgi:hypothetical protein
MRREEFSVPPRLIVFGVFPRLEVTSEEELSLSAAIVLILGLDFRT